jgi:hypothetical protein
MTRRSLIGLGSLFVASFLVTLLYLNPGGIPRQDAARKLRQSSAQRSSGDLSAVPQGRGTVIAAESPAEGLAGADGIPPDFDALRRAATSASTVDDRIRAIQILGEAPTEESLDTLLSASSIGTDPRERAAAITSLRQHLQRHGGDPRIRNVLQAASSDTDPLVAVLAQSALEGFDAP